jgi:putative ABC transport system permease protein
MMTGLLGDVRQAIAIAKRTPTTTIVLLLTTAVAVGANTTMFTVLNAVLLTPLPYPDRDRIVQLSSRPPGFDRSDTSPLNFLDWEQQSTAFEYMVAYVTEPVTLSNSVVAQNVARRRVGQRYFELFGARAALGRVLTAEDYQPDSERVVVVSHALWASQLGADAAVIGRPIRLDGTPYTVIGVMAPDSAFDRTFEQVWSPLVLTPRDMARDIYWLNCLAKLRRGLTLEQARAQMNAVASGLAHDHPESNKGWGIVVDRYVDAIVGKDLTRSLYLLFAAVAGILLIACVNLTTVNLARNLARDREVATRAALGAGRARLVRQFLTESLLLSLSGGLLGVGLGYGLLAALPTVMPPFSMPPETVIRLDMRVLLFTLALSIAIGCSVGLIPAIKAVRVNLTGSLKEAGYYGVTADRSHRRLSSGLIMAELALAFVIVTSSGLLIRSFFEMRKIDTGFESANVLTAMLYFPPHRLADPHLNTYLAHIAERMGSLPGVRDVALTIDLPLRGLGWGLPCQIAGHPRADPNTQFCSIKPVSPSYFRTLGLRLRRGRTLSERDLPNANHVAVINETLATRYFAAEDPIGRRILVPEVLPGNKQLGNEVSWEVVGVIADERMTALDDRREFAALYVTLEQGPPPYLGEGLVIRLAAGAPQIQELVRKAIHELNPDQAVTDIKTLEQLKAESITSERLRSLLIGAFATIAMLLAAIGVYGAVATDMTHRRREFAIRSALGANSLDLRIHVLWRGVLLTGVGLGLGLALVFDLRRLLSTVLFGVTTFDPVVLTVSAGILGGTAMLACYIPARRASRANTMIALRMD